MGNDIKRQIQRPEQAEQLWEMHLTPAGKRQLANEQKRLNILWVDQFIDNQENKEYIQEIRDLDKVMRIIPLRSIEDALFLINLKQKELDLFITNGSLGKKLIKAMYKKLPDMLPYFQVVIFCGHVEFHRKWAQNFALVRFVTNDIDEIINQICNFRRRIKMEGGQIEFTEPFYSLQDVHATIPMTFIMNAPYMFAEDMTKEEIIDGLKLAAVNRQPDTINQLPDEKKEYMYTISEIEYNVRKFMKKDYNYFQMYTAECFVYRETNYRLRKFLNEIPDDIFQHEEEIKNNAYKNKAFLLLKPILPFVYQIMKRIVQLNDPNFLGNGLIFENGNVWRGLNLLEKQIDIFANNIDKIIGLPGFTSCTYEKKEVYDECNTIMEIYVPKRKDEKKMYPLKIEKYSEYPQEKEVLFPAGSSFKICKVNTTIQKGGEKVYMIYLRYVPSIKPSNLSTEGLAEQKTIDIKFQKFSVQEIERISLALMKTSDILNLSFWETGFDADQAKILARGLIANKTLKYLNLTSNKIGVQGSKYLSQGIMKCKTLSQLHLNQDQIGPKGAKHIAKALAKNSEITEICLRGNSLGDEGANYIGNSLKKATSLDKISLDKNCIGKDGAKILSDGFKFCPSLQEIYLNSNNIGDEGASFIARILQVSTSIIKTIELKNNSIQIKGAKSFGNNIPRSKTFNSLDLSCNRIENEGALAIAKGITHSSSMNSFNLSNNALGDEAAFGIAVTMSKNKYIEEIILSGNNITMEGIKRMMDSILECKRLTRLDIENNEYISESDGLLIQEIAEKFPDLQIAF